jgi:hypothetical protein
MEHGYSIAPFFDGRNIFLMRQDGHGMDWRIMRARKSPARWAGLNIHST